MYLSDRRNNALHLLSRLWIALPLVVAACIPAAANVILVNKSASGTTQNGVSWATAYTTVQAAATSAHAGDELWIAAATYQENISVPKSVSLFGGFAGTETDRSQRHYTSSPTILDGNGTGTVVSLSQGDVLDGFTVRNGHTTGVSVNAGPATVTNDIVAGNGGAGIGVNGSATITNDIVNSNNGTGISVRGGSSTITNDTVLGNVGGIAVASGSASILNNLVSGNAASSGGGIYVAGTATITNDTVTSNGGGGIYLASGTTSLKNTIVAFNSSGIYKQSTASLTSGHNDVYGNSHYDYSGVTDPDGTNGNISADPVLSNTYHDVHLDPSSPCVDAGDNSLIFYGQTDIDGEPRVIGAQVDIGCDESDGYSHAIPAKTWHISASFGNDANDGQTWGTARKTVGSAVTMAQGGDEIWVMAGTYQENIVLNPGVGLYGGFAGSETNRTERSANSSATVLDGNHAGTVVVANQGVVIDGFTITNGKTTTNGGGIYVGIGSATITNDTISRNTATNGAGVFINGGETTLARITVLGNTASSGSGIYVNAGTVLLTNSTISGNLAISLSGAAGVYVNGGTATIVNDSITSNAALNGVGGISLAHGSGIIINTLIAFNSSGIDSMGSLIQGHCDVYGNDLYNYSGTADPTGYNDNISVDPILSNAYHDIHLEPGSPCLNAGDDSVVSPGETDIDGQPRVQWAHVDIGSDESDGTIHSTPVTTWRVSVNKGSDANDGLTWATAKKTLGGATMSALGGDEVWVTAGTYPENATVPAGVALYGGFSGTETNRGERSINTNVTTLDGNLAGPAISTIQSAVIDGFTLRNGVPPYPNSVTPIPYGGGIFAAGGSTIITNNAIITNHGSGVYVNGGAAEITNNTIANNVGSGINVNYGTATVANDVITGNFNGHGVSVRGTAVIANDLIAGNGFMDSDADGGGIYVSEGSVTLVNDTVAGNSASFGGGLYTENGGTAAIANSIFAFNSDGIYNFSDQPLPLDHNDVYGNSGGNYRDLANPTGTSGNLSQDPLFASRQNGDYHLLTGSPAIDAGNDALVTSGEKDLDGKPRIIGGHADIGAYEFGMVGPPPFTLTDAAAALRTASGLASATPTDVARLNVETNGGSAGRIDILDAARIARKASGLEANP